MLHTLLSAVLLLAARSLILMSLPLINRAKLYFLCAFSLFYQVFYDFWSNFFKKVTFSDFLRKKVTLSDPLWKKWPSGIPDEWRGLGGAKNEGRHSRDRRRLYRGMNCWSWLNECGHLVRRGPWSKNGLYGNYTELRWKGYYIRGTKLDGC